MTIGTRWQRAVEKRAEAIFEGLNVECTCGGPANGTGCAPDCQTWLKWDEAVDEAADQLHEEMGVPDDEREVSPFEASLGQIRKDRYGDDIPESTRRAAAPGLAYKRDQEAFDRSISGTSRDR